MRLYKIFFVLILASPFLFSCQSNNTIKIFAPAETKSIQFAVGEVQTALQKRGKESTLFSISRISKLRNEGPDIVILNLDNPDNLKLIKKLQINIDELKPEGAGYITVILQSFSQCVSFG